MLFRPFRVVKNHLEAAYKLWVTGGGLLYWDRQKLRVQCPAFNADLVVGLLEVHWQKHNDVYKYVGG